jgi:hypothetical protein
VVLVNDTEHGGCAGSGITFNSTGAGFGNIVLHELGHALGGLGDEYEYDSSVDTYTGGEPGSPNLTIQTARNSVKWFDLITPTTPVPTWNRPDCTNAGLLPPAQWEDVIGTYEGGGYHRCGIYRPDRSCTMRTSSAPFCEVCNRRVRQVMMPHVVSDNLSITPWGFFLDPKVHPYWQSPDVWVDNNGNGVQESGEPSIGKADNHLFARVTNTGSAPSSPFSVTFSYVPFTGVIDMDNAQHIATINRPALAVGSSDDVEVLWDLTTIPSEFAGVNHFCVIVEINGDACATFDNRAQNNFGNVPTVGPSPAPVSMYVMNPMPEAANGRIIIEPEPSGWEITANIPDLDSIPLAAGEEKLVTIEFRYRGKCPAADQRPSAGMTDVPELCAREQFDLSFALDGGVLGGVSSEILVRRPTPPRYRWGFSLHLGGTQPYGNLDTFYGPGWMGGIDIEYALRQRLWLVGLLGYNQFSDDSILVPDGTDIWNLSLNLKYELGGAPWRGYLNGGIGAYFPDHGSTEHGFNLGFGVRRDLGPRWILELGADYHRAGSDPDDLEFGVYHGGLIYRF